MGPLLAALLLAQPEFRPLGDCALIRPVTFSENISELPSEIQSDLKLRGADIYPRTEKNLNFSDFPSQNSKMGSQLLYVAHAEKQWLISYIYGGVAIRVVTISYIQSESSTTTKPYLMGALEGDGCTAANAFLKGVSVEAGWER